MQAIQSRIPKKTLRTTKWAYGTCIWNSWCKIRNISDELTQMTAQKYSGYALVFSRVLGQIGCNSVC